MRNKKKEEESGELVFGQRFDDYKSFKDKGVTSKSFESTEKPKPKKMHAIEKANRARFGDAHVDKLKAKHAAFKANRRAKRNK